MNTELFKNDLPEFREKTADFYAGRLNLKGKSKTFI